MLLEHLVVLAACKIHRLSICLYTYLAKSIVTDKNVILDRKWGFCQQLISQKECHTTNISLYISCPIHVTDQECHIVTKMGFCQQLIANNKKLIWVITIIIMHAVYFSYSHLKLDPEASYTARTTI